MSLGNVASLGGASSFRHVDLEVPPDFIDKLPVAIYACDATGRLLWFNRQATVLWGRTPATRSDSELYCGSYRLYLDGRLVSREETPMAAALRTGLPLRSVEGRVERPDGSSISAMIHVDPIRDAQGRVAGAINCFHDISARVEAQETTRRQEQRLAVTYDRAGIGIAEIDGEGRLLRVNLHLGDLLGYAPDELVGRSIFDPALAEDLQSDQHQFERQVRGEIDAYAVEKRFIRRDGARLWISVSSSSVKDAEGRFLYAVRVQQDVTARRAAEAALVRHVEEQAALYEFTDGLQRAQSIEAVYELALDTIERALHCDRASILLFDDSGTLSFVASRGLSALYRKAVEGHSPWSQDAVDPDPIRIDDLIQADLPDELKRTILDEGVAALSFIPIASRGRLLGKFMTYYDCPHTFTDSEIRLAQTVARQLAFAVDRVQLEAARKTAERAANHLVAIVESSHDAIVSKNLNGVITSWNESAERLFGYPSHEAIGRSITMLIPPERLDEEPMILGRIRRGERVEHFETVRRRKDGALIDLSLTISPIRNNRGEIVGASKIARDISDQKIAEAKLKASERQLRDLLEAIPAAIYTTDANGRITYFNQAAVELSGRTPVIGDDEWCVTWKLYWPDGTPLPHDQCPMAVTLKEGRPVRGVEAIAERPDGTRVPFIPYPTPLRDESGAIVGGINMLVDVSARKEAETQQRLLFNELNHRVKNNMQMLQSLLALAGQKTGNDEARQVLRDASDRIAAMAAAQQILYGTAHATHFAAADLVKAVCETVRQTVPVGLTILYETDDAVLPNDTAMPLALALNELLTNAVKYGLSDGETVIKVGLLRLNEGFCLYVEDRGQGFDLDAVRGRSSGLRLVQGLAQQLRGRFSVTTGSGARCSIHFS